MIWAIHVAGMRERYILGFAGKTRGKKTTWKTLGTDGRIILNSNSRKSVWDMYCIDLAQDGDRWNAVVKAAMDLPVP